MASAAGLTIEDYERLPDALALNHELIDGELVDVSGNTPKHNSLRDQLIVLLLPFVNQRKLGRLIAEQEFAFEGNAHGPDIALIGPAKRDLVDENRRVQPFVPDLAIEIVSRRDTFDLIVKKAKRYRKCGTREVWVFSLENRQAFCYSENRQVILDDDQDFAPGELPGFSIRIGELFDRA